MTRTARHELTRQLTSIEKQLEFALDDVKDALVFTRPSTPVESEMLDSVEAALANAEEAVGLLKMFLEEHK